MVKAAAGEEMDMAAATEGLAAASESGGTSGKALCGEAGRKTSGRRRGIKAF
jgi:hypothetical protein